MERAQLAAALARSLGENHPPRPVGHRGDLTVIAETESRAFMTALIAAVAGAGDVLLANPAWGEQEKALLAVLRSVMVERGLRTRLPEPTQLPSASTGWLGIPTGGTGGRLKFARHDERTLAAAVRGFVRHFDLPRVNAVGLLPLYHVSGLMAWVRCALTGGEFQPLDWKAVESGMRPTLPKRSDGWVISLVPTQLDRLLREPAATAWLAQFQIIFLGGGPAWPALLDATAAHRLPLSLGYGMTETAAMVTALRPEEFLAGARGCGTPLPHATVRLDEAGMIHVGGASLFHGYYPTEREGAEFATADLGAWDARGHLLVRGRSDAVIITGGEKVAPVEVEAVLRASGQFADVVVLGVPDSAWGQAVVAAYPATASTPDWPAIETLMKAQLTAHQRPKRFIALPEWPANESGKVNRAAIERAVS